MPVKSTITKAVLSLSMSAAPSYGVSPVALFVSDRARKGRDLLLESKSLGISGSFEQLNCVGVKCQEPDWDGYGAQPIQREVVMLGHEFLRALPIGISAPTVGAEPDGHLTFEWYKSPHWTVSISMSPDGNLYYSGILGPRSEYGTEPFWGQAPHSVLDLVHQVIAA